MIIPGQRWAEWTAENKRREGEYQKEEVAAMDKKTSEAFTAEWAGTILNEAAKAVGDRGPRYGHPRDNHARTADLWTAYLWPPLCRGEGPSITPRDVCMLNILQKVSRDRFAPSRDNLVDIAGYARNAEMIEQTDVQETKSSG